MSSTTDLVNVPITSAAPARAAAPGEPPKIGVFTTAQSLVTFPVASGLVTLVWRVIAAVWPAWGNTKVVPLVIALLVGGLIHVISVTPGTTRRDGFIGLAVAVLNSFSLAATALGIDAAVSGRQLPTH